MFSCNKFVGTTNLLTADYEHFSACDGEPRQITAKPYQLEPVPAWRRRPLHPYLTGLGHANNAFSITNANEINVLPFNSFMIMRPSLRLGATRPRKTRSRSSARGRGTPKIRSKIHFPHPGQITQPFEFPKIFRISPVFHKIFIDRIWKSVYYAFGSRQFYQALRQP